jgi:hypothetical protein
MDRSAVEAVIGVDVVGWFFDSVWAFIEIRFQLLKLFFSFYLFFVV